MSNDARGGTEEGNSTERSTIASQRPSVLKRAREAQRLSKKQDKQARRAANEAQKADRAAAAERGEDPDLIGIVPGPQPRDDDEAW